MERPHSGDRIAVLTRVVSQIMLFRMVRNKQFPEMVFLAEALKTVERVVPASWVVSFEDPELRRRDTWLDGTLELVGPGGARARFIVETKRSGLSASTLILALKARAQEEEGTPLLYVTDYVNPVVREGLAKAGISYVDGTGWIRLISDDPPMVISAEGAERSPRPRTSSSTMRLNGRAAGRIIRTLLQEPPPYGVRALAKLSGTSPGSVSKLLPTLVADGAVDRDESGSVTWVRRRRLLERWTIDYSFLDSNGPVLDYLAPRGLDRVIGQLRLGKGGVCVTASAAARTYLPVGITPVVPLTLLACYADDIQSLAADLGLVRADRQSSNVLITTPADPLLLTAPRRASDGLPTAPLSLALADLLSLPGRSAQEAEQLMDMLAVTDPTWSTEP
jgi:hypothetical protein